MRFGGFGFDRQFGFSAAATQGGGAAAGDPYGPEFLINGDCSSSTGWNLNGAPVTIAGGKLVFTGATIADAAENTGADHINLEVGETYHFVYTIDSISGGSVQFGTGEDQGTARNAPGTYAQDIEITFIEEGMFAIVTITTGTVTASMDNFSCKKVL